MILYPYADPSDYGYDVSESGQDTVDDGLKTILVRSIKLTSMNKMIFYEKCEG